MIENYKNYYYGKTNEEICDNFIYGCNEVNLKLIDFLIKEKVSCIKEKVFEGLLSLVSSNEEDKALSCIRTILRNKDMNLNVDKSKYFDIIFKSIQFNNEMIAGYLFKILKTNDKEKVELLISAIDFQCYKFIEHINKDINDLIIFKYISEISEFDIIKFMSKNDIKTKRNYDLNENLLFERYKYIITETRWEVGSKFIDLYKRVKKIKEFMDKLDLMDKLNENLEQKQKFRTTKI